MNSGRELPFAAIVQTHFDEALAADGRSVAVLESPGSVLTLEPAS